MGRDYWSVWKGAAGQYGKVEQVSMGRYSRSVWEGTMEWYSRSVWEGTTSQYVWKGKTGSVWKGTAGQYEKVQRVSMERYSRSV